MKRAITALCVLLLPAGVAYGTAFVWDGDTDKFWNDQSNWDVGTGFPDDSGDTALINITHNNPVRVNANVTVGSLDMAGGVDGGTTVRIRIDSTKTLTVTDTFTVGDSGESYVEKVTAGGADGDIDVQGTFVIQGGMSDPTVLVVSNGSIFTS